MTFGLQVFDSTGALAWDSTTVLGGVVADYQEFAAGAAGGTFSYPQWASYTTFLLSNHVGNNGNPDMTLDTSSGTPVVTVNSTAYYKSFYLMAY